MAKLDYDPREFNRKEEDLVAKFKIQRDDAKRYFEAVIKPRLDRSYKLYISYNGDRAREIQKWQANVAVPYIHGVIETLMPRILDARPEFTVQGRSEDDQLRADRARYLLDYTWEMAGMDKTTEMWVRAALIYGTGYLQVSWKKDVRKLNFLKSRDLLKKKYAWKEEERTFYDAPYAEWVDNYNLWYDWHNVARESKQYWFKRLVMTGAEIKRRYPLAEKKRLLMALNNRNGDLTDYASIRNDTKYTHEKIVKGADYGSGGGLSNEKFNDTADEDSRMFEVFEWTRPYEDAYAVMVNDVPILRGAVIPVPYDFKDTPFIELPFLSLPGEFEGIGLPLILENPQLMLNMIKNQRLDAATMNIHKMWIVNPLANINKSELVTRPFGIIYSTDPNGAKEVQFSDVKSSAYREEELLKSDMRYGSGVDDFSMAVGGGANSATEVRHLRESTLERVRLFINHMGDGYSVLMRYWLDLWRQFMTDKVTTRIIGEDGGKDYPIIERGDIMGNFDFRATVLPSIAGKNDIDKKQGMDLFQLLMPLEFIDQRKLTNKILRSWNWTLDSVSKGEQEQQPPMAGPDGQPLDPNDPMAAMAAMQGGAPGGQGMLDLGEGPMPQIASGAINPDVIQRVLASARPAPMAGGMSPFGEAAGPINLMGAKGMPPTPAGVKATNPRGMNRTGKVNTNINTSRTNDDASRLMNQAANLQR